MVTLDYHPIEVDINVDQGLLVQDAFYTVGFITEHDTAPRTVVVNSLQDVLNAGYSRGSNAYNFCKGVLIQGQMTTIVVRAKRPSETYFEAYSADDNNSFYYVVLGSKNTTVVLDFNTLLVQTKDLKLQFFSSDVDLSTQVAGRNLVYYYQPEFVDFSYIAYDSSIGVLTDLNAFLYTYPATNNTMLGIDIQEPESDLVQDDLSELTLDQAQKRNLKYPEGAWLGYCGNFFPSTIQWLYKNIQNVNTFQPVSIPNFSTTCVIMPDTKSKSTLGSGTNCEGYKVYEVVSLDWVRYAMQKKLWEVFYSNEKVPTTSGGMSLLENAVRYVLDIAVAQGIFQSYKITGSKYTSPLSRASFTFEAVLTQTILEVKKVEGTIYH